MAGLTCAMPVVRAAQRQRRRAPLPVLLLLLIAFVLCQPSVPSALFNSPSAPTSGQPKIAHEGGGGEARDAEAATQFGVETGLEAQATVNDLTDAADFARAFKSLKELASTEKTHHYKWRRYCSEQGVDSKVGPAQMGVVDGFLAAISDGSIAPVEVAPEALLQKFFDIEKEDPAAKWLWKEHCSKAAFGASNPKGVPAAVVESFLSQHSDGSLPKIEMASEELVENLVAHIGTGNGWGAFANEHSFGIKDPKKLPADVAQRFLSEFQPVPKTKEDRSSKKREKKVKGGKSVASKKVPKTPVSTPDAKGSLHNAVMKLLKRNPSAEDMVYSIGSEQPPFQATVALSEAVLGSRQSITGEVGFTNKKDAVRSAAAKALEILGVPSSKKVVEAPKSPGNAKGSLHNAVMKLLKRDPSAEDIVYSTGSEQPPFQATVALSEAVLGSRQSITGEVGFANKKDAVRSAAAKALEILKKVVAEHKEVRPKLPKHDLNSALMKLMKRSLVKGEDIIYTVEEKAAHLFIATVTLSEAVRADAKLEHHEGPVAFTGEASKSRIAAEESAAEKASAALKLY